MFNVSSLGTWFAPVCLASACLTSCLPEAAPPPPKPADRLTSSPWLVPPAATIAAGQTVVIQPQESDPAPRMLPAFETAQERATVGKLDANDDFRIANKAWYAQTMPPHTNKFRHMAEWEPMQQVWTTYADAGKDPPIRRMMAEQTIQFVRNSSPTVAPWVIVNNNTMKNDFIAALQQNGITPAELQKVGFVLLANQTVWHIDYGIWPMIEKASGHLAITDFAYYKQRTLDDAIPTRLAQSFFQEATVYRVPFGFEGGNLQGDGAGTCATSFRALKNTGFSELKVKQLLKKYAACDTTYILQDISDDGTGHIDMFFKWVAVDVVLIGNYEDSLTGDYDGDGKTETLTMSDKLAADYAATFAMNQKRMNDNASLFMGKIAANGKPYKVHRLSMMSRFKDAYGDLPRTFINSTFTNGVNVYPAYTLKSCRNPVGPKCKVDADCPDLDTCSKDSQTGKNACTGTGIACVAHSDCTHCAAGSCTVGATARGCDELIGCPSGQQCAPDLFKVALDAQIKAQWQAVMPTWKHVGLRADRIGESSGAIHCITRTIPVGSWKKAIADGTCVNGTCGCAAGGTKQACSGSGECSGPAWVCDCNVCKGFCGNGKACTDDADCSTDGFSVVAGSCAIDAGQGCYGMAPSGGGGGDACKGVSYEGLCEGKGLSYCDGGLKTQTCSGCCGWDAAKGFFDCLSGAACTGCVNECQPGDGGCSDKGSHTWTCSNVGGCWKRQYVYCAKGCDSASGACVGGGSGVVGSCPVDGGPSDSGPTAVDASDSGSPDVSDGNGGPTDLGKKDAASNETAPFDAGFPEDVPDAGSPDSGPQDAGPADSGPADTGPVDVSPLDSSPPDMGSKDACKPQCSLKNCGPDGCGGECGFCDEGLVCGPAGLCAAPPAKDAGADGAAEVAGPDTAADDAPAPADANVPADADATADAAKTLPIDTTSTTDAVGLASDATKAVPQAFFVGGSSPRGGCTAAPAAGGSGSFGLAWLVLAAAGLLGGLRRRQGSQQSPSR